LANEKKILTPFKFQLAGVLRLNVHVVFTCFKNSRQENKKTEKEMDAFSRK